MKLAVSCACMFLSAAWMAATAPSKAAVAAESITINRIADAGFNHSEVVDTAAYLADEIGGRMTNSPSMRKAERWTQEKFKSWGLKDVRSEAFDLARLVDRVLARADGRAPSIGAARHPPGVDARDKWGLERADYRCAHGE